MIFMILYEPCCKLSSIVSWFEVTFKQGSKVLAEKQEGMP